MSVFTIVLVLIFAFLAGVGGILDEFQFHRPLVACTLVGMATGHMTEGILLGGSLELIALGWMNVGAAVAPDAALASIVSAWLVCGAGASVKDGIAMAIPLAVAGQVLTIFVRTIVVAFQHRADHYARLGSTRGVDFVHIFSMVLQGLRILIPAGLVMLISPNQVQGILNSIPDVITNGLAVSGGFIVAVGYAMVINMMATKDLMPFFFLGFALSAVTELNLIAMGIIGLVIALVYLQLSPKFNAIGNNDGGTASVSASSTDVDDDLDDELD